MLDPAGLAAYTEFFRGDYLGVGSEASRVAQWWDLDEIGAAYRSFLTGLEEIEETDPAQAFAAYVPLLTEWRRLPYLDPGLPAGLLPQDWPGGEAHEAFARMDSSLQPLAATHAATLLR